MHQKEFQHFIDHGYKDHLSNVSVDCAVFGFHDNQLKVLLLKWRFLRGWSLPGGYMLRTENAEEAATRQLKSRTGLDKIFLQQFHTFSGPTRAKLKNVGDADLKKVGIVIRPGSWLTEPVVSVGYYALVEYSKITEPKPDFITDECAWCDIHTLPKLLFDHADMIKEALKALRIQINHQPIGLNLLPKEFTMTELQSLYETILDARLDRGNFRKKILSLGILKKTGERPTGKAHKTPHLYSFEKKEYSKALKKGINFL